MLIKKKELNFKKKTPNLGVFLRNIILTKIIIRNNLTSLQLNYIMF